MHCCKLRVKQKVTMDEHLCECLVGSKKNPIHHDHSINALLHKLLAKMKNYPQKSNLLNNQKED